MLAEQNMCTQCTDSMEILKMASKLMHVQSHVPPELYTATQLNATQDNAWRARQLRRERSLTSDPAQHGSLYCLA